MLGCGWVPKDPIQANVMKRCANFGKYQDEMQLPIGFRNLTPQSMKGELTVTGEAY